MPEATLKNLLRSSAAGPVAAGLLLYAALLAACFVQCGAILPEALERHTPDDTYYFFQIARNMSAGLGSCFSPGEATNGYHPLWVWVAALLQRVLGMSIDTQPVVMVSLGAAFAALSAAPLVAFLRSIGMPDDKARFAALVYVANPWMACLALSGMETGLFLLLFFSTFALFARVLERGERRTAHALAFGCLAGLLMLCRTDSVFFVGAAMVFMALRRDRSWSWLLTAGLVATAVVGPWLVWSWVEFGTIQQSSSDAIGFINRENTGGDPWRRAKIGYDFLRLTTFKAFAYPLVRFTTWAEPMRTAWAIVLGTGLLAHVILSRRWPRHHVGWPLYLVLPLVALVGYFCFVRHFMQVWHITVLVVMCVVVGARYASLLQPGWRRAVVVVMALASLWATRNGFYAPQDGGIARARQMAKAAPRLIGHTDCGRFGYFSGQEVINLDGVVNNEVLQYLREGRLGEYILSKGIEMVFIVPEKFRFYNRRMPSGKEPSVPSPESIDAGVKGNVDRMVVRDASAVQAEKVELFGWVVRANRDSAASLPLVTFLDQDKAPLVSYRARRIYRADLAKALTGYGVQYGGFELSMAASEVPELARYMRLGVLAHDGVCWSQRVWPVAFQRQ